MEGKVAVRLRSSHLMPPGLVSSAAVGTRERVEFVNLDVT